MHLSGLIDKIYHPFIYPAFSLSELVKNPKAKSAKTPTARTFAPSFTLAEALLSDDLFLKKTDQNFFVFI